MGELEQQLQTRFGLQAFRPWQREAIEAVLHEPRRALVVAPTGGGKSLTYQLPATLLPGTSLVISPLIALMEDQVRGLRERGIAATFLASTLSLDEQRAREEQLRSGELDLVYVAPERLASERMMRLCAELRPPLVAIDEAHCISQWGHDFRPDYLRLGHVLSTLRPAHVLACTATATPMVRDEILARLGLGDAKVVLRGFARPNLHLEAIPLDKTTSRRRILKDALKQALGSPDKPKGGAIVYSSTRRGAEKATSEVAALGFRTGTYHAGLGSSERASVNQAFGSGELDVVAATNAFGMGIDRPDIRIVVHSQAPGSIEAYYQEVGRAGRDGEPATGLLLSSSADLGLRRRLIERSWEAVAPPKEHVKRQWQLFLDLMRYIEAGSCRHDFILRYFGDDEELLGGCGHCDVCEGLTEGAHQSPEEAAKMVLMGLSGIARVRGQVGLKAVAEMLAGKDNEKLRRWGLDRLSTHGLMKERDIDWILALLRRLITAGYVDIEGAEYPKPILTSRGVSVMKGKLEPQVLLPRDTPKKAKKAKKQSSWQPPSDADPQLFNALREMRIAEAKRQGVPAYIICSDRTLASIAAHKPQSEADLLDIHGLGPSRVASYGQMILDVVRNF